MDVKTSSISATSQISRRSLWVGASALLLAGCQTTGKRTQLDSVTSRAKAYKDNFRKDPHYLSMYAALPEEKFPLPAVDLKHISDQRFLRQLVPFEGPEPAGTLVVDPKQRFLYVVNDDGTALRYGVGVGRAGFGWEGDAIIQYKRKWPRWTPPAEMIARQPELEKYRNGMEPGLDNALGARALYLFDNGRDTLYRLHGTNEPSSIGKNVSSGCIRLLNQDVIDLYNRVPDGTRVIVRSSSAVKAIQQPKK